MSQPSHEVFEDTRSLILRHAIALFAAAGYNGVSMRSIAKLVGISAPGLYHHFPDKASLYLAAMQHAFADKTQAIRKAILAGTTTEEKLDRFVASFTRLMAEDPDFRALLQRELLDGDETRLKLLADSVFKDAFKAISDLARELDPACNPHLLAISMTGLVLFHFETAPIRRFLPGGQSDHEDPTVVSLHVRRLLGRAFGR